MDRFESILILFSSLYLPVFLSKISKKMAILHKI